MKAIVLLLAAAMCCGSAGAQVPVQFNYQGHLTDAAGVTPVNGVVSIKFRLYTDPSGGTAFYTEIQSVAVTAGLFDVLLGSVTPIPANVAFDQPYWLGITVGTDNEMTPRQLVAASPYAIRAATAEKLASSATVPGAQITGSLSPTGNIVLADTNGAAVGNIIKGANRFMHNAGLLNTFVGEEAGNFTTFGNGSNTAFGANSLQSNTTGYFNVASGAYALQYNLTGYRNVATGMGALGLHTGGRYNTAVGDGSLAALLTGFDNTGIGARALETSTGSDNIALGFSAGLYLTTGNFNIDIGNFGVAGEGNTIRIGDDNQTRTFIAGINGVTPGLAVSSPVVVDANGQLGTIGGGAAGKVFAGTGTAPAWTDSPSLGGTLAVAGRLGVGTTTPTKAKVEISGFVDTSLAAGFQMAAGGTGAFAGGTDSLSLYADLDIAARKFVSPSDARIKRIEGRSDAARDLDTLAAIEVTDYTYIDTRTQGSGQQKKVIAQQLERVYPKAVTRSTDVVPDIYRQAEIRGGWVQLATSLKKGDRVRLIGKHAEGVYNVLETAPGRFRTDLAADGGAIFVFGREVKDFRNVDYDAVAMLNVSATQELRRRTDRQAADFALQAAEMRAQTTRIAELEQERRAQAAAMAMQAARIAGLERQVSGVVAMGQQIAELRAAMLAAERHEP